MIRKFFFRLMLIICGLLWLQAVYAQESSVDNQPQQEKSVVKNNSPNEEPPKIGNFSLPNSQQPGPLIGMGDNMVNAQQLQLYYNQVYLRGADTLTSITNPSIVYGIRNDLSVYLSVPFAIELENKNNSSSGIEDMFLQLEYAFYLRSTRGYTDQATVLGNVTFPTGSSEEKPPTGFGATSYNLGTTFNRTYVDWFMLGAVASLLTTSDNATKFGNQYFYQAGLGRNIYGVPDKWIIAWLIELDGEYAEKNKIHGDTSPNSGGNTIYVTPSFWLSSPEFILQAGAGVPVVQNLFGEQSKNNYLISVSLGWTI